VLWTNYRLGRLRPWPRVWPGDGDLNGDRIGKGSTCASTRLRVLLRMLCRCGAFGSRLSRRSRLELDYDLHASSLVRCGWVLGSCWVHRKAYLSCTELRSNRPLCMLVCPNSLHPTAHSTRCRVKTPNAHVIVIHTHKTVNRNSRFLHV